MKIILRQLLAVIGFFIVVTVRLYYAVHKTEKISDEKPKKQTKIDAVHWVRVSSDLLKARVLCAFFDRFMAYDSAYKPTFCHCSGQYLAKTD